VITFTLNQHKSKGCLWNRGWLHVVMRRPIQTGATIGLGYHVKKISPRRWQGGWVYPLLSELLFEKLVHCGNSSSTGYRIIQV